MSQRTRILSQISGFRGWKVVSMFWEDPRGNPLTCLGYDVLPNAVLVLRMARRWAPRCQCQAIVPHGRCHARGRMRRWKDLPCMGHPTIIEYAPDRLKCRRCGSHATELVGWADPKQRQTRRLQQHLALDAFSMPVSHVAAKHGLSWRTVRRAESAAIARWETTRTMPSLRYVGLDEKWLGRRHKRPEKFVTIVSDLESGEPVWMGYGRDAATVKKWLGTISSEKKTKMVLFASDMHAPFKSAVRGDPDLGHVAYSHDPFHIMKRAGEAISELRRELFFRAGAHMRGIGRGACWLLLRPWDRLTIGEQARLRRIFAITNGKLARAYQTVEQLRLALKTTDDVSFATAMWSILKRCALRSNIPMRKLHDSLLAHMDGILAFARNHPPTGRIEALNNNWESLVRRGRGHRDLEYLCRKLRFIIANPIRNRDGIKRFLSLGLPSSFLSAA